MIIDVRHLSPEEEQLTLLKIDGRAIQFIENPSEKLQLAAVRQSGTCVRHIKNPTTKVKLAALKSFPWAIKDFKNMSESFKIAAVKQNMTSLTYIENPSEAVQLAVDITQLDYNIIIFSEKYIKIGCQTKSLKKWMALEYPPLPPLALNKLKQQLKELVLGHKDDV